MRRAHRRRDGIDVALRLLEGDARAQARDHVETARTALVVRAQV